MHPELTRQLAAHNDCSFGQDGFHGSRVLHQYFILLATTDELHMAWRALDFFGCVWQS